MKNVKMILVYLILTMPALIDATCGRNSCAVKTGRTECPKTCMPCFFACCGGAPYCGPYPRPLPGQYDSYSDNTRIKFWNIPPCAPRNDSKERGYLYKGMWWDVSGVRYWAFRNSSDSIITVEGIEGGEIKDIPAGDVVNIARGESYSFRIQAPARRFELFNSDAHAIEVFINSKGDIDYREEPVKNTVAKGVTKNRDDALIMPKF